MTNIMKDYVEPIHDVLMLVLSLISNACLLYLAGWKSRRRDCFNHFVILSSCLNVVYSVVIYLMDPELHAEDEIFILFSLEYILPLKVGDVMLIVFWSLCPTILVMTTAQFVHRYLVICRGNPSTSFARSIPYISGIVFVLVFSVSYLLMKRNETLEHFVAEHMEDEHHIDVYASPLSGLILNNHGAWEWKNVAYIFLFDLCYGLMVITIVACSLAIYKKWKANATVKRFKSINKQIVSALCVQALAPFFCNVIPIMLTITLPIFGLHLADYINIILLVTFWFPLISSCATIFLIREYKNLLLNMLPWKKEAEQIRSVSSKAGASSSRII